MEVVSDQSDKELATRRALEALEWALQGLAANLIRVARGAGKPASISGQADALLAALYRYNEAAGVWPSAAQLSGLLRIDRQVSGEASDTDATFQHGIEVAMRGALQMAASRLLGQWTIERSGERQLFDGIRLIEDAREEWRLAAGIKPATTRRKAAEMALAKKGRRRKPPPG